MSYVRDEHYCEMHQGDGSHYSPDNCVLCRTRRSLRRAEEENKRLEVLLLLNPKKEGGDEKMLFVAILWKEGQIESNRSLHDWACFLSESKDVAISKAIDAKRVWELRTEAHYSVIVGEVKEQVLTTPNYKLLPMGDKQ